jgi:hypothetical protein
MVGRHWVKISMAHSCQGNLQFDKSWGGKIGIEYTDKQSWIIFLKKKKKRVSAIKLSWPLKMIANRKIESGLQHTCRTKNQKW